MANYNVGNLEVEIKTNSSQAVDSLNKVISALSRMDRTLREPIKSFESINKLANGLKKINNLNFRELYESANRLRRILEPIITQLNQIQLSTNFTDTANGLNKLANALLKINKFKKLDFKAIYQSFSTLNRIITPFLDKLNESRDSLIAFDNILRRLRPNGLNSISNKLKTVNNDLKQTNKNSLNLKNIFNIGKIYFFLNYTKRITSALGRAIKYASDYSEILNKYQVSFVTLADENLKITNKLSEAFGISTNTLMDYTSTFNNMLKGLKGLTDETSARISQTLTKMAIDYSSLFNQSVDSTMKAFQSVLAGQVRPIRSVSGFDVSETTIFSLYKELGGQKTMRQLNQLEKRLLRIASIQRQMEATGTEGDYARTIETVSNQIKIMKEQLIEVGKYLGQLALIYLKPLIVYVNAVILTLKNMLKYFADMKANKDEIDYKEEFASFEKGAENAEEAVESLKYSLLGLDKLNILGANDGNIASLEVEQRILDSVKNYAYQLENVKYKAKEISERMLTWLGFTSKVNEETGETNWILNEGKTNLKTIETIVMSVISFFISSKIVSMVLTIYEKVKGLIPTTTAVAETAGGVSETVKSIAGSVGIVVALLTLALTAFTDLYNTNEEFRKSIDSLVGFLFDNIKGLWDQLKELFKPLIDALNSIWDIIKNRVGKSVEETLALLNGILMVVRIIIEAVTTAIDFIGTLVSTISDAFGAFGGFIGALLKGDTKGATRILGDFWNSVEERFTNVFKKIGDAWKGLLNNLKEPFRKFVNVLVDGFNVGVIDTINGITSGLSNIWTWLGIPEIPNIPHIPNWNVPELASGGVVRENTLVNVGEYANARNNPEIIAPQDIMQETFMNAVTPLINAILSGDNNIIKAIKENNNTQVYMNGRKVSEAIYDDIKNVAKRKGQVLFGGSNV